MSTDGLRIMLRGTSARDAIPRGSFEVTFDAALAGVAALPDALTEPDGSVAWAGRREGRLWRITAQLWDGGDRLDAIEVFAHCPAEQLKRFVESTGQPIEAVAFHLATVGRRVAIDELARDLDAAWSAEA